MRPSYCEHQHELPFELQLNDPFMNPCVHGQESASPDVFSHFRPGCLSCIMCPATKFRALRTEKRAEKRAVPL